MAMLDWQEIRRAAEIIRNGGLVAMPTETVYGLAADATNDRAVARIFEAKGRPRFNPLIVHVSGQTMAEGHAEFSRLARRLALAFWPGPLTLVLPRKPASPISMLVSAGLDTIAVRMPAHDLAHALIKTVGAPLAAPSANRSGALSPTAPAHVEDSLGGGADCILDGGRTEIGIESTIVKVEDDRAILLRPGGACIDDIERTIGALVERPRAGAIEAPGMLASHYAPDAMLRLSVETPDTDEFYLAFGRAPLGGHPYMLNLSSSGDLRQAAAQLFAYLRSADRLCRTHGLKGIAVAPIPATGLGEAINDRLAHAAAPRR